MANKKLTYEQITKNAIKANVRQTEALNKTEWNKHFDKVRIRMALRMSNDVGSKVSYKDMNFFQSVKVHTKQKTNDVVLFFAMTLFRVSVSVRRFPRPSRANLQSLLD